MNRPVNLFWSESSHYFGANSPVRNFERNVPEESSREELVLERTVPEPKKYHSARRKHNVIKTDSSKNDLSMASRFYKKTMNAHINKFRKSQQTKLRKMQKSQPKEYWKYLNSLKTKSKTEMPSLTQFHDFFSEVYSNEEVGINDTATHESTDNYNEFLNQPFSPSEIEKCIRKLKNSKSPGKDQILNEYLKLTKDKMLHVYVNFFNLILDTGHIPDEWLEGRIKPIYKNKGDAMDPNNYRPITLLSCMGKLFTAVLNERLTQFLEDNDLLKPNQAGFRNYYATTDHIFALYSLIELLKHEKKKLYCCFEDFSKAFDSVWRAGLWSKLLKTDINGNFLRILQNMYLNIKSCVSVDGNDSPFFFSNRGVRQGDNISPVLFSLFLNDLEDYFEAERCEGIPVECMTDRMYFFMQIYVLLYADDTVIMGKNSEDLQDNLNIFSQYCSDWKLDVNKSKTKIVIFGAQKNLQLIVQF